MLAPSRSSLAMHSLSACRGFGGWGWVGWHGTMPLNKGCTASSNNTFPQHHTNWRIPSSTAQWASFSLSRFPPHIAIHHLHSALCPYNKKIQHCYYCCWFFFSFLPFSDLPSSSFFFWNMLVFTIWSHQSPKALQIEQVWVQGPQPRGGRQSLA